MSLTLVIGGTRSGKSAHAERLAIASGLPVTYLATADCTDPTMAERIATHAARRPQTWRTIELGVRLPAALDGCVLLDGLGVWIARGGGDVERVIAAAADAYVIVVAEEAGSGVHPESALARGWIDRLGEAVQQLSTAATRVELVVAGRALALERAPGVSATTDANRRSQASRTSHVNGARHGSGEDLRRHGDRDVRPGDADHAVNVMVGGPPDWLREALRDALERAVERYPDEREACEAVALLHGRDAREVIPTNGAAEALWLLPAALRPGLAACVHPAFTEGEAALRAHGTPLVRVMRDPDGDFALDPSSIPHEADLVIAGNPASPCGTLTPAATLLQMRRPGRVLVVDEAFMDLVPGEPGTIARERLDDVIVIRSLTKALSIPGLRAGYALTGPGLAERLRAVRPPWSANALALAALGAAARRPDALAAMAERAQSEREDLLSRLAAIPNVCIWPGAANFCLVGVPDGPRALAALREQAIAVRPAASFPGLGPNHLRITARDASSNRQLAAALQEAVRACV